MCRGHNIGVRLVEDYLARMPNQQRCHDMRETAQAISKVCVYVCVCVCVCVCVRACVRACVCARAQ